MDLILYDIKHMDPKEHKKICGKSNKLIISNIKKLTEINTKNIIIRIPVIPGINDSIDNVKSIADFVSSLNIKNIDLLPYFKYHLKKYERLNRKYSLYNLNPPTEEKMQELKGIIEKYGLFVHISE